ncbi:hypothetical protein ACQPZP_28595 [Spirillospora sp. CA-142024]|uniref:hypothetical protein n=1 Tax=Spirillospora sp. CA-142024 TaxID=3240036 RepID=UPI003D8E75CD
MAGVPTLAPPDEQVPGPARGGVVAGAAKRDPGIRPRMPGKYGVLVNDAWLRRSPPGTGRLRAVLADEAALLLDLPSLPGLPSLLGVEMTAEAITIVTAMQSPATLRERLTRTRPIPARDELTLLASTLPHLGDALGALHDRGLAHRALGPGTILMPEPGTALLCLGWPALTGTLDSGDSGDVRAEFGGWLAERDIDPAHLQWTDAGVLRLTLPPRPLQHP